MTAIKIDKLKCCKPKSFWAYWGVIVIWMLACIVNTFLPYTEQIRLDAIGFFVLYIGMASLTSFTIFGSFSQKKEMLNTWKDIEKYNFYKFFINAKTLLVIFSLSFLYIFIMMLVEDFSSPDDTRRVALQFISPFTFVLIFVMDLFLYSFISLVVSVFVLGLGYFILGFLLKFIYVTIIKHSGRMRRIGLDFVLLFIVLVAFLQIFSLNG